jgi:hypothetical protein
MFAVYLLKIYLMKTIKRKVLVVAFMLGTLFSYAHHKDNFSNTIDVKKVKVVFNGVKKGHTLTIKDQDGIMLHSENVSKEGNLIKFFDLSALKEGNYNIELNKDVTIIVKPFQVKSNTVIFKKDLEREIFKPVIRNKENTIFISKKSFDNDEPVKIILYYNDDAIYNETVKKGSTLNKIYKLDATKKGNYRAVVLNNGRNYIKEFKI